MTQDERIELKRATGYSLTTIAKWDLGQPVSVSTHMALGHVAANLGYARKCDKGRKAKVVKVR